MNDFEIGIAIGALFEFLELIALILAIGCMVKYLFM
jgi:hypothetical protein